MQMTKTTHLKRITRGGAVSAMAIATALMLGNASNANAQQGSGILGGAIIGGAIGGAVGGKKGLIPGAIIGGVVGGAASSARARPAPPPQPRYYAPAYTCGLVCGIQNSLTKLGYNPGPVDGVYGKQTADAIGSFEYNNQLPVTGQATPQIHNYMKQLGG